VYDYGDGKRIEFSGPEPLGADDLRILQGLVAMAGPGARQCAGSCRAWVRSCLLTATPLLAVRHLGQFHRH
ncbi:replication protein C, IncQ-type, partial [Aeromonas caviae]|uniref:replication protein C, IncQ-type n=1 Tax=Aeromonas caviae TaxID=648 RepID=UPI0022A66C32